ncbi:fluoride efflux transporter FluC [Streptomyces sp. NBC_01497]|uniref:fluoride efflux transporter FluC n=1 Tax=Streptomyces sp. NBC_01497 TaxID=2903885 RepID=UPI002E3687FC|nr:CrcB family protein [Streptomyces sp. NBC_01497]
MNWLMVITGAIVGAPLRYLTDRAVQARHDTVFPWGTFTVNIAACAALGFLTGAATATTVPQAVQHLIGPGLCATLSTYSTFSFESLRLAETGSRYFAIANAGVSIVAGLGAAYVGAALAQAVFG